MSPGHEPPASRRLAHAALWLFVLLVTARCDRAAAPTGSPPAPVTLRVGVGQVPLSAPEAGMRQLVNILSMEALVRFNDDGRPRPWLAERWTVSADGRELDIQLHPRVAFHDGTPLTPSLVADVLKTTLPRTMGPAFADVESITAVDATRVRIRSTQPSPFLLESLESDIQKPGGSGVGTGPFKPSPAADGTTEMVANGDYYLGRPPIARIAMTTYPTVRAAWADLLRARVDMLYEVGADALDSLRGSSEVSLHTFTRRYQYVVLLNTRLDRFRSAAVRQALNAAVDRTAVVREALNGYGVESNGPVSPKHWAVSSAPAFGYDPELAARALARGPRKALSFACLVPPDVTFERIALVLKRQLEAAGVEMTLVQSPPDRMGEAFASGTFEAALVDIVSGPSLFRPFQVWHSKGPRNLGRFASATVDAAFARVFRAADDDQYRTAVGALQQAVYDDPPAIFVAWAKRARAVDHRFTVPDEGDRDIITTIRQWQPAGAGTAPIQ